MADKTENILVEFDYNNIIIVDPNKVIDENGNAKERLVKQEDLVFYANLECKVLPRTKLALGVSLDDAIQTISVATINFLKPGGKTFMDESYTDEITGKDSIKGEGVNQPVSNSIKNPQKDNDYYIRQTINSYGKPGAVDNGLLGITYINIRQNTAFNPTISITLEDVKGRALFESGDNSPYATFFNMPYPLFYLTIKGYFGKAVRLALMLQSFNARYDSYKGNFVINLEFYPYKYSVLSELPMATLLAAPHMYKSRVKIQTTNGNPGQFSDVDDAIVEKGYQKIKEMYSEYKTKGLIADDFPEITLVQLQDRVENFIKNTLDNFSKQNLTPLTDLDQYQNDLNEYSKNVFYTTKVSWFDKYMDQKNFYVLKETKKRVYTFKTEINTPDKKQNAISELKSLISKYNDILSKNNTVGSNGKYTVNNKEKKLSIPNGISYDTFLIKLQENDVDLEETYRQRGGKNQPTGSDIQNLLNDLISGKYFSSAVITLKDGQIIPEIQNFIFEGNNRFIDLIDRMGKDLKARREEVETELTNALGNLLQDKNNGIGFVPNIRNVLAVIFASGEAFLRMMDDVHTKAWEQRDNKYRKEVIFNKQIANASADNLLTGDVANQPVYPFPQLIVATTGDKNQELYEIRYPGDPDIIDRTKAYLFDVWAEVEFVEEFIKGLIERTLPPADPTENMNQSTDIMRTTLNSIEFPISNVVFSNKEEVKYFYEIYERVIFISNFSKLSRAQGSNADESKILNIIAESESENIIKSLSNDNPFIIEKLKYYNFNSNTFPTILRQFSNGGVGESWQNYIRGIFNTGYIKNLIDNSGFEFLNVDKLGSNISQPQISLPSEQAIIEFISGSTGSNRFDFTDTFPFTNKDWVTTQMANGTTIQDANMALDTRKSLLYNTTNKVIANFSETTSTDVNRPITNFVYKNIDGTGNLNFLGTYYAGRSFDKQFPTEGNLRYINYSGGIRSDQTVSILNTPYFVNAIQEGVKKFRQGDDYPFVSAAYYFINSLPLATLREKYKTYSEGATIDLDYIFATLKKYGAVHKLPYAWVLKIGSVWHRYKKSIEDEVDILDESWKDFPYLTNYDPITSAETRTYNLIINGAQIDIVLQDNNLIGAETSTLMNVGFYPKTINDFNVFYQGFEIIGTYTTVTGSCTINATTMTVSGLNINDLQPGAIISGSSILADTQVVSQISGVPNGDGDYVVSRSQNLNNQNFVVTNYTSTGYTSGNIQDALTSGLTLNYVAQAIINKSESFDPGNPNRDLRIIPWTVTVNTLDGKFTYAIPSEGSLINQTNQECFTNDKLTIEVSGNTSVFNGSVRTFWAAPNFGYFDNSKISKPSPYYYLKQIFSASSIQENFSLNGDSNNYESITDLFSVFEKSVLDGFEQMFLDFSKSIYDYDYKTFSENETETQKSFKNFQMLMRNMMRIPTLSANTAETIITELQSQQLTNIGSYVSNFLNYDIAFKYGNPSRYDRRLFYTFSSLPLIDPYTWNNYTVSSPFALPYSGGNITLANSRFNYPEPWKKLLTYVGFSDIPQLEYKDSGSFITDFFIDMNIAFNVDNIERFAPIIRMYATQKLNQFQSNVIPPPTFSSVFISALATLKDGTTVTVEQKGAEKRAVLRNSVNLTLFTGLYTILPTDTQLINEAIENIYGSTSTNPNDNQYIVSLTINTPAQYSDVPNSLTRSGLNAFYDSMTNYLTQIDDFQGKIIDNLMPKVRFGLPNVTNTSEGQVFSDLQGTQSKVELWESFKALNDKWIAGGDFKNKTLFEDVLLLDRASRNIGDKVLVDVFKLKNKLVNIDEKNSMLNFVQTILIENHFVVMNIPSYVNFYNVQNAVKNPKPKTEGTLEFANTLFGTFLNVDYRESGSKLVCFYSDRPSEVLDLKNNVDFRFRNDAFDLRRASDNPLVENQIDKNDWDKSNRVVGFNVDIGPQNQQLIKSFSVGQEAGKATSEAFQIINQMANLGGNRAASTQNISLYNLYKNRSYSCTLNMMGNALIQPTMYFNLRYVPMFTGPYMILEVNHTIEPGDFTTSVVGIRQPTAALPKVDQNIQALRTNLLKTIIDKNKQNKPIETKDAQGNVITQKDKVVAKANRGKEVSDNPNCTPLTSYGTFYRITPQSKKIAFKEAYNVITSLISSIGIVDDKKLKYVVFAALYLESGTETGFEAYENNFSGVELNENWGNNSTYFSGNQQFFCLSSGGYTTPYAVFNDLNSNVYILLLRWKDRMFNLKDNSAKEITKFWIINDGAVKKNENVYTTMPETSLKDLEEKVQKSINIWNNFG
jgi:hypothetical protein